jgi:cell division protein FtsQ
MWDNPRMLNTAAGALVGVAAFVFLIVGVALLLRSPLLPITTVELTHSLGRTTRAEIETATRGRIGGNFFAVAPAQVRAGLEQLPWVRRVSVRRVWPDRLEVTLEEHVVLARWGGVDDDPQRQALVNTYGERFNGRSDEVLPTFLGPAGSEREMAHRYARFSAALAPLGSELERLVLTPRYAWQLRLASGLHVMLGRDAEGAEARLRRFVEAYPATLGSVAPRHEYIDLRYPNGFALRVPALRG